VDDAATDIEDNLSPKEHRAKAAEPGPRSVALRRSSRSRLDATSGADEAVSDGVSGTVTRQPLHRRATASPGAEDRLGALATLTELRGRIALLIDEHAVRAIRAGWSYGDIARALGISRQAAHRRYRDAAAPRVVATAQTRRLLQVAREEAVRARARALGSEHLLVAALRCGGAAAEALADAGVTLQRARTYATVATSESARDSGSEDPAFGLRRVLRVATGTVTARRGRWLDANTLLLAALSDPDDGASRVLAAVAVDPSSVQRRLRKHVEATRPTSPRSDRDAT